MFTRIVVEEMPPSHLVSIRLLLAALLLGPIFINKEEWVKMSKAIPFMMLLGIINAALPFFLFSWSAQELSAGMLSILNGTQPLLALIIAIALFLSLIHI